MKEILEDLVNRAFNTFVKVDWGSILGNVSERSLCARLALHMHEILREYALEGYYVDTEYNRQSIDKVKTILDDNMVIVPITCDLVLHRRGGLQRGNLIAIEMKKSSRSQEDKKSDKNRLRALTKNVSDGIWSVGG